MKRLNQWIDNTKIKLKNTKDNICAIPNKVCNSHRDFSAWIIKNYGLYYGGILAASGLAALLTYLTLNHLDANNPLIVVLMTKAQEGMTQSDIAKTLGFGSGTVNFMAGCLRNT